MKYGYLDRPPDEAVYYETVDIYDRPIIIAAERVGDKAQVAVYRGRVFEGGMYPLSWEQAKEIAQDQFGGNDE